MTDAPQTRYVRSGDANIAYQVIGDGPVDILVLPHFFHHLELWWDDAHRVSFVRGLMEFARVILFDKRGTGMSDRTCGVPSFDVQMDDIAAVLDAARSERTVLWAGGDASMMMTLFAASFPQRALGLVLWDPYPTILRKPDAPWLYTPEEFAEAAAATGRVLEEIEPAAIAEANPTLAAGGLREYWRVSRLGTSRGDHEAFGRALVEADVRHVLPTIRVPTLVLTNEALAERHQNTRYVAEKIPTARLEILPGRDRMMLVGDAAAASTAAVRAFVDELRDLPPEEPDRVLATVLFTDIVGSTARSAALGDAAWRELLREHHSRVRRELARFRGREVDTAGDGFFATFDGPARAIRCACAVRDSLRELGLDVRAGLHAGECELLDDKVTGIAVHVGARVAAQAHPGDVLVSSTVRDLVAGSGIEFEERGTAELRGVPGEWRLYAVT
jgi:class 3 adenylate cyclase